MRVISARQVMFTIATAAVLGSTATAQSSWNWPRTCGYNEVDGETLARTVQFSPPRGAVTYSFAFGTGTRLEFLQGWQHYARYDFGDIMSGGGGAILRRARSNDYCTTQYTVVGNDTTTQRLNDWSGASGDFSLMSNGDETTCTLIYNPDGGDPCSGSGGEGGSGGGGAGGGTQVEWCLYHLYLNEWTLEIFAELDHCWIEYV